MDFALTEDQLLIRDAAEDFLRDASDSAAVRAAMASAHGFDERVWQRISRELGWCATAIPERYDGLGLGMVELILLLEQMGRRLLCSPFFSTATLGATLLNEVATEAACQRLLPGVAGGALRVSAPLPSAADDFAAGVANLQARRESGGWVLKGACDAMVDAVSSDWLLLLARVEGENSIGMFAVPSGASGLQVECLQTWDRTRRLARVECSKVAVTAEARIDDVARAAQGWLRAAALARLALAAEQLGAAQQCLDLTVAYTSERRQFGRAIASFQAVKHRCAEMMVRIEALRSAVYGTAAFAAGEMGTDVLAVECAATKALASDTLFWCAQETIQLHGGVGFTWEYDPQLYFKRAQSSSHWLGSAEALRERVAIALIDGMSGAETLVCA